MRNLVLFFSVLILGTSGVMAAGTTDDKVAERNAYRYNDSFIFVEKGITFSVYPDGEFDFYIDNRVSGRRNGVTFNSGFDYSPYAQYDDYGAVIQVENVPIFYDHYGRVTQVGDVDITYNNGRVRRLGGMNVYYNRRGFYDYHTGFINVFNRHYVYRPFHGLFARPSLGFCLVFGRPYRRFYSPIRYTYYNPYRYNTRRAYAKVGRTHRYNQVRRERSKIYRNDKRVAVRNNAVRSNRSVAKRGNTAVRNNRAVAKRSNAIRSDRGRTANRNSAVRPNSSNRTTAANRTAVDRTRRIRKSNYKNGDARTSNGRAVTKRSTTVRVPKRNTTVKRTVTRTPSARTVTRSTKTYKAPQKRTVNNNVRQAPTRSRSSAVTRSSSARRNVSKAPSRSRSSVTTRSSSSRRTVSKAPARSSRNTTARNASSRSSRRY
mgnify:CR=1 FL=1